MLVYHGRHRYNFIIRNFNDAEEYYCTEQCSKNTDQDEKCWFRTTSKEVVYICSCLTVLINDPNILMQFQLEHTGIFLKQLTFMKMHMAAVLSLAA